MATYSARYWRFVFLSGAQFTGKFDLSEFILQDQKGNPLIVDYETEITATPSTVFTSVVSTQGNLGDGDLNTVMDITVTDKKFYDNFYLQWDAGVVARPHAVSLAIKSAAYSENLITLRVLTSVDGVIWTQYSDRQGVFRTGANVRTLPHLKSYDPYYRHPATRSNTGGIFGIVSEDGVIKSLAPVFLMDRESFTVVQRTLSDDQGAFAFRGLDESVEYFTFAIDDDGTIVKNAARQDHVLPIRATLPVDNRAQHTSIAGLVEGFSGNFYARSTLDECGGYGSAVEQLYPGDSRFYAYYSPDWVEPSLKALPLDTPAEVTGVLYKDVLKISMRDTGIVDALTMEVVAAAPDQVTHYTHIRMTGYYMTDGYLSSEWIKTLRYFTYSSSSNHWYYEAGGCGFIISSDLTLRWYYDSGQGYETLKTTLPDAEFHHISVSVSKNGLARLMVDGAVMDSKTVAGMGSFVVRAEHIVSPALAAPYGAYRGLICYSDSQVTPQPMENSPYERNGTGEVHLAYAALFRTALTEAEQVTLYENFITPAELQYTGEDAQVLSLTPQTSLPLNGSGVHDQPFLLIGESTEYKQDFGTEHYATDSSATAGSIVYAAVEGGKTGIRTVAGYYKRLTGGGVLGSGRRSIRVVFSLDQLVGDTDLVAYNSSVVYDRNYIARTSAGHIIVTADGHIRFSYTFITGVALNDVRVSLTNPLGLATMYDLVLTHDPYSGMVEVYINGLLQGTSTLGIGESVPNASIIYLGGHNSNLATASVNASAFFARTDVFPRILTSQEIALLAEA